MLEDVSLPRFVVFMSTETFDEQLSLNQEVIDKIPEREPL